MGACALESAAAAMADRLESKDESTTNPCCTLWKDKYLKVLQKCKSTEERRATLKQAVNVLMKQVDMMQDENLKLKKSYEEEKMQADRERKEKEKESDARVSLENDISALKSLSINESEELKALRACVSDKDKDINCLREQLQKKRANEVCGSSKVDQELSNLRAQLLYVETEKKRLIKDAQMERARADSEKKRADEWLKTAKFAQTEVEVMKSNSDLSTLKSEDQSLKMELARIKELLDKEKKRADLEKKNAIKVKEMLKTEQSRTDEQRMLVDVEKKKAEELSHQLQRFKCEADEAKSKLVSEGSKFTEANKKKLEAEKKKTIKEKKKAEAQQKIAEMSTKLALEEKQRAVRFQQELEEYQKKYDKLKKDIEQEKRMKANTVNRVRDGNLDMAELKTAVDTYKMLAMKEKSRADKLAEQLEVTKKVTTNESEEISEKRTKSAEMKLVKKRLKLEKERVKHAYQVAELERKCQKSVEQELHQLKLEFARFSNRIGLCSCFDFRNVGKSSLEKNAKRNFIHTESGNELVKTTKSCKYSKPNLNSPALSLPMSGTPVESTSGTACKMESLLNRKKLDNSALVSSMASFSDRQLVVSNLQLPISRLSSENAEMADNNVQSPPRVRKKKRLLNVTESIEHLYTDSKNAKVAKNMSALHDMLGQNDKTLKEGMHSDNDQQNERGIIAVGDKDVTFENTCNDGLENIKNMFIGDYMKLLDLDSEVEEGKFRTAIERPLSPTLPNIKSENNLIGSDDFRSSDTWSIVVFPDIRDINNLSKIFHMTKTFSSQFFVSSQTDNVVRNIISALSADESLLPKEKVCVFFSLLLKSFSNIDLTNFNNVNYGIFLDSTMDIFSGQLRKGMSDVETRTMFTKACDLDELITLVQSFIINGNILVCSDITSEALSIPDSKASLCQLVVGAVFLASICADFDRIDSICETSYSVSRITSSSTLTVLHIFALICREKLLSHTDYSLIMTVVKSLVTYCETRNLASGFPLCAKCPFSEGAVSMEELSSLLLNKLNDCCMQNFGIMTYKSITFPDGNLSNLGDVLSLLELLASKMSWGWVCENIISGLLKLMEECVMETPMTSVFVLLGQIARFGIDANGFQDPAVENIRVKLTTFISQSTSRKIGLPIQFASVKALLGTIPLSFQEICNSRLEAQALVSYSTVTDSIQKWFSVLSDEHKSLSVKLLTADVS